MTAIFKPLQGYVRLGAGVVAPRARAREGWQPKRVGGLPVRADSIQLACPILSLRAQPVRGRRSNGAAMLHNDAFLI